MRRLALTTLVLAACASADSDPDDFPVEPAGAPESGGGTGGASGFVGRVCVLGDLRDFGACGETAGGLTVTLGAQSAITENDGTFRFETTPSGANLAFGVTGEGVVPSTAPFSPASTIHAVDADLFARELTSNGLELPDGTGTILGTVTTSAGIPATGVTVESAPLGAGGPFYDGDGAFVTDRTGARGVFMVPGVTFGAADLTFTGTAGVPTTVNGVSVVNGGVTILNSVVLP